jgi:hypothetical protein
MKSQFEIACDLSILVQKNHFEEFQLKMNDLKDYFYLKEIRLLCEDLKREDMLKVLHSMTQNFS